MAVINVDVFDFNDFTTAIGQANPGDTIKFFIQNDIVFPNAAEITKALTVHLINANDGDVTLNVSIGGTYRHFTTGTIPIADVTMIIGNRITLDGGDTGGGVFVFGSGCSVTLNGCIFRECRSNINGGGVLVQGSTDRSTLIINDGTIITDCRAVFGGGASALGCNVTLNNALLSNNTASNSGGGIHLGSTAGLGSALTVNGGTIADNTAVINDGGGINAGNTIVTIWGGVIRNNMADVRGGGINVTSTVAAQSALRIHGGTIIDNRVRNFGAGVATQNRLGEMIMTGGLITQNSATIANGNNQGGGIYYEEGTLFEFNGGRVTRNTAASGGGIFINNSVLIMNGNAEVDDNEAYGAAGGIYGFQGCTITISENARITDNKALSNEDPQRQDRGGGGIALLSYGSLTTLTVEADAVIEGNSSVSDGGGIWFYPNFGPTPVVNIYGGHIQNNTAGVDGGGIGIHYEDLPNLTVAADVIFANNRASRAFDRNPIDDELYFTNIFATDWTVPFPQGYNNYDIEYTNGEPFVPPEPPPEPDCCCKCCCFRCCRFMCNCRQLCCC